MDEVVQMEWERVVREQRSKGQVGEGRSNPGRTGISLWLRVLGRIVPGDVSAKRLRRGRSKVVGIEGLNAVTGHLLRCCQLDLQGPGAPAAGGCSARRDGGL